MQRNNFKLFFAAVAAAVISGAPSVQARDVQSSLQAPPQAAPNELQAACFAPGTLTGLPGETSPVKGHRDYDAPPRRDVEADAAEAVPAAHRGSIRRVDLPAGEKLIALTFDLCEQRGEIAGYDGDVFDYLRREKIKATLFAGGKWMRSHQARTEQLMSDPLFEIANHSESHRNLRLLDGRDLHGEIDAPQVAYVRARRRLAATQCAATQPEAMARVPAQMSLFRFPFGACNAASLAAVGDAGLLAIQWDVSLGDPDPQQSAEEIAKTMLRQVRPGSIIVAHANGRGWHTAEALPLIIPKLKAQGYTFVTVSELLARGKPVISESCYNARPGDTDRYDFVGRRAKAPAAPSHRRAHIARERQPDPGRTFEPSVSTP